MQMGWLKAQAALELRYLPIMTYTAFVPSNLLPASVTVDSDQHPVA